MQSSRPPLPSVQEQGELSVQPHRQQEGAGSLAGKEVGAAGAAGARAGGDTDKGSGLIIGEYKKCNVRAWDKPKLWNTEQLKTIPSLARFELDIDWIPSEVRHDTKRVLPLAFFCLLQRC